MAWCAARGRDGIETVLYYRAPVDEAQAPEAQASGSEVVAAAPPEAALEPETAAPPVTPLEEEVPSPPPPFVDADDGAEVDERVVEKPADWVSQEELMRQAKTASHLFNHD